MAWLLRLFAEPRETVDCRLVGGPCDGLVETLTVLKGHYRPTIAQCVDGSNWLFYKRRGETLFYDFDRSEPVAKEALGKGLHDRA